jgi:hypothetical protein
MSEELSKDVVALLQYLAPGFIMAWVYYGLTSHNKPSQFERLVQALIFTVVIQALVIGEQAFAEMVGKKLSFGTWSSSSQLIASLLTALVLGFLAAVVINGDAFHRTARKLGISTRSGHPCEWFGIFKEYPRYVVLQLKDGTRIYGWPTVWPSEYDKGHFFITSALRSVGEMDQELDALEGILIDARDVASVEFIKPPPEETHDQIPIKTTYPATSAIESRTP